jgi:hypothetical protein
MSSTHLLFDLSGSCFLRCFTSRSLNANLIKSAHRRLMSFEPEQLHEVLLCDDLTTASHWDPNVFFSIVCLNTVRVRQSGTPHFKNNYQFFLLLHRAYCFDYFFNIPTHAPIIYTLKNTKFTLKHLKHLKIAPTCFGPFFRLYSGGSWTVLYAVTKLRSVGVRSL